MITKIRMGRVTSYKAETTLVTDKKVNLIYGLNGTGKSTISDFLMTRADPAYAACGVEGLVDEEIIVYNQKFVQNNFYVAESLQGIFTLSEENKDAAQRVKSAQVEIEKFRKEKETRNKAAESLKADLDSKKENAQTKLWEIKTKYTGGDRVLEFCLEGLKGRKESLFDFALGVIKPAAKPNTNTDQLRKQAEAIRGKNAQKYARLPEIILDTEVCERNPLFKEIIIGNENSAVAALIQQLSNSDWVKEGLAFIPSETSGDDTPCPFCQKKTINAIFIESVRNYFDESYEKKMTGLKNIQSEYARIHNQFSDPAAYTASPFVASSKAEFENLYSQLRTATELNKSKIANKISTPSMIIDLQITAQLRDNLNTYIAKINKEIEEHNRQVDNQADTENKIKKVFWEIMRWDYDQTLSAYQTNRDTIAKQLKEINREISEIETKENKQASIIIEQQSMTVNVDAAVQNINNNLREIGINDFSIEKHRDTSYKLVRSGQPADAFQSLSEGEKMIISFFYFVELCKGKKTATAIDRGKIVVIDDPISSLSHIYVFNVGQLIKRDFFNSASYKQIFVLTHSLYFFYELADMNHKRRGDTQASFRIIKNDSGSLICEMKYDEIQNDYQAYWAIVKDERQPAALIANCMRNIVEYFFNFIERRDLNNVFLKPELQDLKYQAFCRYMNRESHSLGQNIFDYKEFDYAHFREALGLLFEQAGYPEHYKAMTK